VASNLQHVPESRGRDHFHPGRFGFQDRVGGDRGGVYDLANRQMPGVGLERATEDFQESLGGVCRGGQQFGVVAVPFVVDQAQIGKRTANVDADAYHTAWPLFSQMEQNLMKCVILCHSEGAGYHRVY